MDESSIPIKTFSRFRGAVDARLLITTQFVLLSTQLGEHYNDIQNMEPPTCISKEMRCLLLIAESMEQTKRPRFEPHHTSHLSRADPAFRVSVCMV